MSQGAIQKAVLHYRGEVARRSTRLITAAFAAGLLESHLDQQVNIVNAPLLAAERGIEIVEQTSSQQGDFTTLLRVDLVTDKKSYTAAGTLFGNQFLRLVQLGPYHLDAYMDGVMLLFTHRDVPGLIGFIGNIFGKHQVNIAQMTVGRQQPGGEAIAVLNLDALPPEDALKEVRAASANQQRQCGQAAAGGTDAAVVRVRRRKKPRITRITRIKDKDHSEIREPVASARRLSLYFVLLIRVIRVIRGFPSSQESNSPMGAAVTSGAGWLSRPGMRVRASMPSA